MRGVFFFVFFLFFCFFVLLPYQIKFKEEVREILLGCLPLCFLYVADGQSWHLWIGLLAGNKDNFSFTGYHQISFLGPWFLNLLIQQFSILSDICYYTTIIISIQKLQRQWQRVLNYSLIFRILNYVDN